MIDAIRYGSFFKDHVSRRTNRCPNTLQRYTNVPMHAFLFMSPLSVKKDFNKGETLHLLRTNSIKETKFKPKSNSHHEITLWKTSQWHPKTFYPSSVPSTQVHRNSRRSSWTTGLWSLTTRTLPPIFPNVSIVAYMEGQISQRPFGHSYKDLLNLKKLANSSF